jgi:hypothetical protein
MEANLPAQKKTAAGDGVLSTLHRGSSLANNFFLSTPYQGRANGGLI